MLNKQKRNKYIYIHVHVNTNEYLFKIVYTVWGFSKIYRVTT